MQSESPATSSSSALGSSSGGQAMNSHLSYPPPQLPVETTPRPRDHPRPLLKERLYVGNLHPSVDEYTLLQLFTKFGKVSKLDYLFHKTGPLKGKPRGYAFVEFSSPDDAERALVAGNDKLLRGRKLIITHAHQAPLDLNGGGGAGARFRRGVNEAGKPTTLSMLKSAASGRSDATDAKIAKMEAKLRELEQSSSGSSAPTLHPSLPPKPLQTAPAPTSTSQPYSQRQSISGSRKRTREPLPSLPLSSTNPSPGSSTMSLMASPFRGDPPKKLPLTGVRIVKKRS